MSDENNMGIPLDIIGGCGAVPLDPQTTVNLDVENWMSKLTPDEIYKAGTSAHPRLCGLRRLARPFIFEEDHQVQNMVIQQNFKHDDKPRFFPFASVTYRVRLVDGRVFSDAADAYYQNCSEFGLHATAIAASRAEARTLRKVLNIKELAAEEVTSPDTEQTLQITAPAQPEQIKLIQTKLAKVDLDLATLIKKVTTREVFSVHELTTQEATAAIKMLNEYKKGEK